MGSPTLPVPPDLAQILRQKQLTQNMANLPVQSQGQPQAPQQQQMSQINPRDMALADYRQALEQGAPQLSQYHPSTGRRILGGVLGALAGMHDPKSGAETAQNIVYGPYESQLSDYQRKIANAKAAFEAENAESGEEAKESELTAQKGAEEARQGSEEARKKSIEYDASPEGRQQKIEDYLVEHPGSKVKVTKEPVTVLLKNGEKINAVQSKDSNDGSTSYSYLDNKGKQQFIGLEAIDEVHPLESKEAIQKTPKPTNEEQDLSSFAKSIGKKPEDLTFQDRLNYNRQMAQAKQTPELAQSRTSGASDRNQQLVQSSYNKTTDQLDKDYQALDNSRRSLDALDTLLSQNNAQADAEVFPKLMQAMLSGSSGFRMTMPEINNAIKGRTTWESLQALLNKFKAGQSPQIPPEQRAAIVALSKAYRDQIQKRLDLNNKYLGMAAKSSDPTQIRGYLSQYRDELNKLEQSQVNNQNKPDSSNATLDQLLEEKKRREQQNAK